MESFQTNCKNIISYLLLVGMFLISQAAYGQWLCPWENRLPITIKETSDKDLSDHQVRFDITFQTGMKADFSDIRFTSADGTTLLDFWVEYHVASTSAIVWVEIPKLEKSAELEIYLYYCNTAATNASNAKKTFVFFDDFTSWAGWKDYGTGVVEQDNTTIPGTSLLAKVDECDPNGGYKEIGTILNEFRLISREIRLDEGGNSCSWNRYGMEDKNYNGYNLRRNADVAGSNSFGYERRNNGSASNASNINLNQPRKIWYRTELRRCEADANNISTTLYGDDRSVIGSHGGTDTKYDTFDRITIRGGRPYYFDFIAVAKYTCSDPKYSIGTLEQDLPTAVCQDITVELDADGKITISANDVDNGSKDECGIDKMEINESDFDCEDIGTTTIKLIVTDLHGNTASCKANVTIKDNLDPEIKCPDDITIEANTNNCSAKVKWDDPKVRDNCKVDGWKSDYESGDIFPVGVTTVKFEVRDVNGNSTTCSFDITVKPTAVTPIIDVIDNSGTTNDDGLICNGDNAKLDAGAGYSNYTWSTTETTSDITVATSNTYSVTVSDAIGCTGSTSTEITVFDLPTGGTCNVVHDHCMKGTGSVELQATGGTAPYQFSWLPNVGSTTSNTINNSGDKATINNIPGGNTISITLTDANGCSAN